MTARRRHKLQQLAAEIPLPEVDGDQEGEALIVGWVPPLAHPRSRTQRPTPRREHLRLNLRHLNPLPNGLEKIFARFKRIIVAEMNDQAFTVADSWPPSSAPAIATRKSAVSPRLTA